MGAPTENIEDDNNDDYDYVYPDSSCGDYPEDDVVNGTSTGKYLFFEFLKVQQAADSQNSKYGEQVGSGCLNLCRYVQCIILFSKYIS